MDELKQTFGVFEDVPWDLCDSVETEIRYAGYLEKENREAEKQKKLEDKILPSDIDYSKIEGLRLEARQKLMQVKPRSLGQAGRISGVNPADIAVLMVWLKK